MILTHFYKSVCQIYFHCYSAKERDGRTKEPPLVPTKGYKLAMRAKPLYNNGYLEAPDGELLCRCDNKKALW